MKNQKGLLDSFSEDLNTKPHELGTWTTRTVRLLLCATSTLVLCSILSNISYYPLRFLV